MIKLLWMATFGFTIIYSTCKIFFCQFKTLLHDHGSSTVHPMKTMFFSRPSPFLALWAKIFILSSITSVSIDSKMLSPWQSKRYWWISIVKTHLQGPPEAAVLEISWCSEQLVIFGLVRVNLKLADQRGPQWVEDPGQRDQCWKKRLGESMLT